MVKPARYFAAMNVSRETNADFANEVFNHPAVKPFVAPLEQQVDVSQWLTDSDNYILRSQFGIAIALRQQPGYYELHSASLPEGRGAIATADMFAVQDWMFVNTDAISLATRVPISNRPAKIQAMITGFKPEFTTGKIWQTPAGREEMYVMRVDIHDWVHRADALIMSGRWFHDECARQLGATHDDGDANPDEHNRVVGAALEMWRAGMQRKSIDFYNRWALLAGYSPVEVAKTELSTMLFVDDCVLEFFDDTGELLIRRREASQCQ